MLSATVGAARTVLIVLAMVATVLCAGSTASAGNADPLGASSRPCAGTDPRGLDASQRALVPEQALELADLDGATDPDGVEDIGPSPESGIRLEAECVDTSPKARRSTLRDARNGAHPARGPPSAR